MRKIPNGPQRPALTTLAEQYHNMDRFAHHGDSNLVEYYYRIIVQNINREGSGMGCEERQNLLTSAESSYRSALAHIARDENLGPIPPTERNERMGPILKAV